MLTKQERLQEFYENLNPDLYPLHFKTKGNVPGYPFWAGALLEDMPPILDLDTEEHTLETILESLE